MTRKILFVDEELRALDSFERQLRKEFDVSTAKGGKQGLAAISERGPFAVVVSDLQMPEMSGIDFLRHVRESFPNTVRILFTANHDWETAIDAVNQGNIFRFLTKPCAPEMLFSTLRTALNQYHLITAEQTLLEKTLHGSIRVLTEILSLINPSAFGRATRIRRLMAGIAGILQLPDRWQYDVAGMLSQIGCLTVPEQVLDSVLASADPTEHDQQLYNHHPEVGAELIAKIPRLELIAAMVAYQEKHFDGTGTPMDSCHGDEIPLGARMLKVCLDFDRLTALGESKVTAFDRLFNRTGRYDRRVLTALEQWLRKEVAYVRKSVTVRELRHGMMLAENLVNTKGTVLLVKGHELTDALLFRIKYINHQHTISEPISVLVAEDS